MLAVEFLLCLHMGPLRLGEGVDSSDSASTSASVVSLASGCRWLEDAMLEPLPVEEPRGGYGVSFVDLPILWKSPAWKLQSLNALHCNTLKYSYF